MKKLAVLALLVSLATGCSKKGNHEKACNHMMDLATKDIEKNLETIDRLDSDGSMKKMVVEMKEQAEKQRDSDLATCVSKMSEHDVDTRCILAADTIDEASACLRR